MKKGFTLVELLAVIALLAIIVAFIVPNVLKTFNKSKSSLSEVQKKQIEEALEMYLNDCYFNPIELNDEDSCMDEYDEQDWDNGYISIEEFNPNNLKNYINNICKGELSKFQIINNKINWENSVCDL